MRLYEYTDKCIDDVMSRAEFLDMLREEMYKHKHSNLKVKCDYNLVVTPSGELRCILMVYDEQNNRG